MLYVTGFYARFIYYNRVILLGTASTGALTKQINLNIRKRNLANHVINPHWHRFDGQKFFRYPILKTKSLHRDKNSNGFENFLIFILQDCDFWGNIPFGAASDKIDFAKNWFQLVNQNSCGSSERHACLSARPRDEFPGAGPPSSPLPSKLVT